MHREKQVQITRNNQEDLALQELEFFEGSGQLDGALKFIIKAPPQVANRVASRLHMYYDTMVEQSASSVCEIVTLMNGRRVTVCEFDSSLPFSQIMVLFRLKARTLGLTN